MKLKILITGSSGFIQNLSKDYSKETYLIDKVKIGKEKNFIILI